MKKFNRVLGLLLSVIGYAIAMEGGALSGPGKPLGEAFQDQLVRQRYEQGVDLTKELLKQYRVLLEESAGVATRIEQIRCRLDIPEDDLKVIPSEEAVAQVEARNDSLAKSITKDRELLRDATIGYLVKTGHLPSSGSTLNRGMSADSLYLSTFLGSMVGSCLGSFLYFTQFWTNVSVTKKEL